MYCTYSVHQRQIGHLSYNKMPTSHKAGRVQKMTILLTTSITVTQLLVAQLCCPYAEPSLWLILPSAVQPVLSRGRQSACEAQHKIEGAVGGMGHARTHTHTLVPAHAQVHTHVLSYTAGCAFQHRAVLRQVIVAGPAQHQQLAEDGAGSGHPALAAHDSPQERPALGAGCRCIWQGEGSTPAA